jgi:glycosyltransferase involved in cell wall biosynthesis
MVPVTDRYTYNKLRRTAPYRNTLRYLQDIIDIEEPDVIHVHNFPRIEVLDEIRVNVPVVRTIHSYENLCGNQLKRLPDGSICTHKLGAECYRQCSIPKTFKATRVRAENRLMKTQVRRLIAVSSYIKDVLVSNGFPTERIRVLNNFTRLTPGSMGVAEEDLVLYVGRITPEKGLLDLIRSIALTASKPGLLVVGKDAVLGRSGFHQQVVNTAAELNVRLEFQDWCAGDKLRAAYQRAKVIAFSSVWPEPFGLVGIEAMMQAKPVVAFDSGGVRDWLTDGKTGFLVPHLDHATFAERLDRLVTDDRLRADMGTEAQRRALHMFSADAHIAGLLEIYKEVVDEDSAHRPGWRTAICDAQRGPGLSV